MRKEPVASFENEIDLFSYAKEQNQNNSIFSFSKTDEPEWIIALDEVGRGCLAGPVAAAASIWKRVLPSDPLVKQQSHWTSLVDDSKKMTEKQRKYCLNIMAEDFPDLKKDLSRFEQLNFNNLVAPSQKTQIYTTQQHKKNNTKESLACFGVCIDSASVEEIDSKNIWNAVQLAMGRAITRLVQKLPGGLITQAPRCLILIDGKLGLQVPKDFSTCPQFACVGADSHFISVGVSSVAAKVCRDTLMEHLDLQFPEYKLATHKGYATRVHREALQKYGPSSIHRHSFLGKICPEKI